MKYTTTNPQKLRDYAFKYYFRYFPSNKKLLDKITQKADWDSVLAKDIFDSIKHLLQEDSIIRDKIKNYLQRNKNLNYIKQKLLIKLFPKDSVENILKTEFLKEWESLLSKNFIIKKINLYKDKWKSRRYIKQKLVERKEDVDLVEGCLNEIFQFWEYDNIKKEYNKLKSKYSNEQIINKLLMKGFNYSEVSKIVFNSISE